MSRRQLGVSASVVRISGRLIVGCRTGIAAGSPIPIDLMKQLIEKLNLTELTVAYGMSASQPLVSHYVK